MSRRKKRAAKWCMTKRNSDIPLDNKRIKAVNYTMLLHLFPYSFQTRHPPCRLHGSHRQSRLALTPCTVITGHVFATARRHSFLISNRHIQHSTLSPLTSSTVYKWHQLSGRQRGAGESETESNECQTKLLPSQRIGAAAASDSTSRLHIPFTQSTSTNTNPTLNCDAHARQGSIASLIRAVMTTVTQTFPPSTLPADRNLNDGSRKVETTIPPTLPFNLQTLKAAIPSHCFEKSTAWGLFYLFRDFAFLGCCYLLYPHLSSISTWLAGSGDLWVTQLQLGERASMLLHAMCWMAVRFIWWNIVGFFGWCLFVVGHDCGHRTFSSSVLMCDLFGHLAHTPLLVPFHGWRISHRKHHEHHNHVEQDHSWRPVSRKDYFSSFLGESIQSRMIYLIRFSHALLLIFPIYLLVDSELTSGNHFVPWSRLFAKDERKGAILSTTCILVWVTFLFSSFPLLTLIDAYFIPYLCFVAWLDLVTYLHHTDTFVHYYRDQAWSFLLGGLSTIDRSYGRLIDHLHHSIGTHVVHHLFFTRIPHYHLNVATEAIKPLLGDYYHRDDTPILTAYTRNRRLCKFVEDEGQVVDYLTDDQNVQKKTKDT